MKLVIIGAGSAYTPEIFSEILLRPQLGIKEVALLDISEGRKRTEINAGLRRRMLAQESVQSTLVLPTESCEENLMTQAVKQYERLTVEAAVTRSRKTALQALINHPLVLSFEKAKQAVAAMEDSFSDYIKLEN